MESVKAPQRLANFRKGSILFVDGVAVELTISGKSIALHVDMVLVQNFVDIVGGPIRSTVRNVCVKTILASSQLFLHYELCRSFATQPLPKPLVGRAGLEPATYAVSGRF